ncbi:hypothetical protein QC762_107600 [Podospora pseudocomata]|uniref:Velvet domain-containing protein n=1 Tax=Podospora pseudocomata TaxID=2093779 RepID=A0ABR0GTS6_9PEZI|nr:hypothetical protein QC762_107600 [Podospora pseudocomata]
MNQPPYPPNMHQHPSQHPHQHPHPHQQQHPHQHQQPHPLSHQHQHQHPHPQHQSPYSTEMHPPAHPVSSYPPHQIQPLPSMPPPSFQDGLVQAQAAQAQGAPPPGPASEASPQSGSGGQERPPLTAEQLEEIRKNLIPFSSRDAQGRKYTLDVVQQPQRARMCGFGDKDRRPITPPPCVRLIVTDENTGKEIDCNEIEYGMYVLNVDLWDEHALKEVNLVRHTTASPSISSTSPASYAQMESTPAYSNILPSNIPPRDVGYGQVYPPPGQAVSPYGMQPAYGAGFVGAPNSGYGQAPYFRDYPQEVGMSYGFGPPRVFEPSYGIGGQRMSIGGTAPSGMFTRNLIGSLAASAFRLNDPDDKIGIWFVLQDLSVRTEGCFRLRFSFVNVGIPMSNPGSGANGVVNQGSAPVLAAVFSEVFQVYSAKKFPGVCESTPLSKCFATQGIKIPIRKDGHEKKGNADDDDDYGN